MACTTVQTLSKLARNVTKPEIGADAVRQGQYVDRYLNRTR